MLGSLITNIFSFKQSIGSTTIIVVCGGVSNEKEVSLTSGEAVYFALKEENLNVVKYILTEDILEFLNFINKYKKNNIIVFNALHGGWGEDGTLAAFLNSLQIPYTHSGVTASAIGIDKFITKQIAKANNIEVPNGWLVNSNEIVSKNSLGFPLVIKANKEGSSVGVYIVNSLEELKEVEKLCVNKYGQVLVEEYLPGEEFSVGLINGKALDVTAIIPLNENNFYDYKAKYNKGGSQHILPAKINNSLREYMLNCTQKLYKIIGCKGILRSDFKEKNGKVYLLEINTHPGFTATSLLPEQANMHGISFNALCLYLLQDALTK